MAKLKKGLGKTEVVSAKVKAEPKRSKGGNLYLVRLMDGGKLGAVLNANSKPDAKEAFTKLCGIRSTEHPITVSEVEEEDVAHLEVDGNGVVKAGFSAV